MPQIVYTGSSLAHPLQGLSDMVQGLSEGRMEREKLDALLGDAAQRHLLNQRHDQRSQEQHDWDKTQRPIEASQRDALFDLNKRKAEQGIERDQIELDAYKSGQGQNYDQATLDDYDAYTAEQLAGLEGEDGDPAALQALQAKVKTRRGMIESAGMGMLDPKQRAAAKAYVGRMMMSPLQDEASPLVREQTRRMGKRIAGTGGLASNSEASAELNQLIASLDTPGANPRHARSRIGELQNAVSRDLFTQGAAEAARQEIATRYDPLITDFDDRLELLDLDAKMQTGAATPKQVVARARELAIGGGSRSGRRGEASREDKRNEFLTEGVKQGLGIDELRHLGAFWDEMNPAPAPAPERGTSRLPFLESSPKTNITEAPGVSAQSAAQTAAPTTDMAAQGAQAGGSAASVKALLDKGDVKGAMKLAGETDPEAPQSGNPALEGVEEERVRGMSDEQLSEGSVLLDPKLQPKAQAPSPPRGKSSPKDNPLRTAIRPSNSAKKDKQTKAIEKAIERASGATLGGVEAFKGQNASRSKREAQAAREALDRLVREYKSEHTHLPPWLTKKIKALGDG